MFKTDLSFKIHGEPKPQAQPKYLNGGLIYSPKSEWRILVQTASFAEHLRRKKSFTGPLMVHLSYYFKRPQNHYRHGKFDDKLKFDAPRYCNNGYSLEHLNKAVIEALTDSALIMDERVVVELSSKKNWEDLYMDEGIIITIVALKGIKHGKEHEKA